MRYGFELYQDKAPNAERIAWDIDDLRLGGGARYESMGENNFIIRGSELSQLQAQLALMGLIRDTASDGLPTGGETPEGDLPGEVEDVASDLLDILNTDFQISQPGLEDAGRLHVDGYPAVLVQDTLYSLQADPTTRRSRRRRQAEHGRTPSTWTSGRSRSRSSRTRTSARSRSAGPTPRRAGACASACASPRAGRCRPATVAARPARHRGRLHRPRQPALPHRDRGRRRARCGHLPLVGRERVDDRPRHAHDRVRLAHHRRRGRHRLPRPRLHPDPVRLPGGTRPHRLGARRRDHTRRTGRRHVRHRRPPADRALERVPGAGRRRRRRPAGLAVDPARGWRARPLRRPRLPPRRLLDAPHRGISRATSRRAWTNTRIEDLGFVRPHGVKHHYAPLAKVTRNEHDDGRITSIKDERRRVGNATVTDIGLPPLTGLTAVDPDKPAVQRRRDAAAARGQGEQVLVLLTGTLYVTGAIPGTGDPTLSIRVAFYNAKRTSPATEPDVGRIQDSERGLPLARIEALRGGSVHVTFVSSGTPFAFVPVEDFTPLSAEVFAQVKGTGFSVELSNLRLTAVELKKTT